MDVLLQANNQPHGVVMTLRHKTRQDIIIITHVHTPAEEYCISFF